MVPPMDIYSKYSMVMVKSKAKLTRPRRPWLSNSIGKPIILNSKPTKSPVLHCRYIDYKQQESHIRRRYKEFSMCDIHTIDH